MDDWKKAYVGLNSEKRSHPFAHPVVSAKFLHGFVGGEKLTDFDLVPLLANERPLTTEPGLESAKRFYLACSSAKLSFSFS